MKKLVLIPLLLGLSACAGSGYVVVPQGATTYTPRSPVTMIAPAAPLGMPAGSRCEADSRDRYRETVRSEDGQVDVWRQDRTITTNVDCKGKFILGAPTQPAPQQSGRAAPALTDSEFGG